MRLTLAILLFLNASSSALAQTVRSAGASLDSARDGSAPANFGVDAARLARIDALVEEAIAARLLPGAVVLVGRGDAVVYQKAFGDRAVAPARELMTLDSVFDLASLTKVVATTTAVMTLVEEGRLRLTDRVATHIPGFDRHGKANITIAHLLTHVSGLRPDVDLDEPWTGYDTAIELARNELPVTPPGERFVYSDINFFLLGDIVARLSGRPLDVYTREHVFAPLGMRDTGFLPGASLQARTVPTERCAQMDAWPCKRPEAAPLHGVVHDPTARRMGGVAGHAGVFGTAADLARFARMLLNGGELDGTRVLAPLTVRRMTTPSTPVGMASVRGLGWDIDTSYSSNRGELLPIGSFGHTGFTGTSLWVDPTSGLYIVFLSSRLHPDGVGDVTALRARIATVAAAAITSLVGETDPSRAQSREVPALRTAPAISAIAQAAAPRLAAGSWQAVIPGIDVLARNSFSLLSGKRVGLVTNHTGRTIDGRTTIDLLHGAPGVKLVALFSPEHGIRGIIDEDVVSSRDERTGLPIHSLYGATRRPTAAMLQGLDTIVIDLQDVGSRFYTYAATIAYVMEEAARHHVAVIVLDRPNPVNGEQVEGPMPDAAAMGFNAYFPMPVRHGMTLGELAQLFNAERRLGANLTVVPMSGWTRGDWFDETALAWVNPSPNMRNLTQATVYPGIGAIEWSNISVGRGTDQPFEQIGAPFIDGPRLAAALNARELPGIRFYPVTFTPTTSKYKGEACQGVFLLVTDRNALAPVRMGLEVVAALARLYPDGYKLENTDRLFGSKDALERAVKGDDPAAIATSWQQGEAAWRQLREKYLLYPPR